MRKLQTRLQKEQGYQGPLAGMLCTYVPVLCVCTTVQYQRTTQENTRIIYHDIRYHSRKYNIYMSRD